MKGFRFPAFRFHAATLWVGLSVLAAAALLAETPAGPIPASPRIPPTDSDPAAAAAAPLREGSDTALLRGEIAALRNDLQQLRGSLNLIVNQITADLRRENEQLRQENRLLRRQLESRGIPPEVPALPQENEWTEGAAGRLPAAFPEPDLADAAEAETPGTPAETAGEQSLAAFSGEDGGPAEPPGWEMVASWGREPEDAQALGPDILSQKGVVGVTAPGGGRNALIALGRAIRRELDRYDIISVDIFDDRAEAEAYARNRHPDPAHRVLSVSRHVRTGQDVLLLYHNGLAEALPVVP
mgnify:CR=1 FL=1